MPDHIWCEAVSGLCRARARGRHLSDSSGDDLSRRFDAVIVGAGQAGPPLAGRLTAAGMTVALIERKRVGGTCVNAGCTPTKTLVASARTAHVVRRAAEFGIETTAPQVDMQRVRARMHSVVGASRDGLAGWLDGMEGLTQMRGQARLVAPDTVEINGETLHAPRIFLNVGARPSLPDMPGIDAVPYLTSTTILELDRVPKHLVIVGGSYIGLEFAQMYRRFGAEVTVVERAPALIPREDPEVSAAIRDILEHEGIAVRLDADCIALAPGPDGVCVHVSCAEGAPEVHGTDVLLAVGRAPNTADLGVDAVPGDLTDIDRLWLTRKLKQYDLLPENGVDHFQKIVAGKKLWSYDNLEPAEKKIVL